MNEATTTLTRAGARLSKQYLGFLGVGGCYLKRSAKLQNLLLVPCGCRLSQLELMLIELLVFLAGDYSFVLQLGNLPKCFTKAALELSLFILQSGDCSKEFSVFRLLRLERLLSCCSFISLAPQRRGQKSRIICHPLGQILNREPELLLASGIAVKKVAQSHGLKFNPI